ncbi:MAG: hypothetical protein PHT25_10910 [Bacteroidales bacterium]|nr:hypothetical protein [Bacteroidales bacterium]
MASSKLSEKDTQTIIRYAIELSNTLNKYGNENTEWEEIRLDMFQALSEKYPDLEEIQNLYADCLYILSGGHSYYYTRSFYYDDAVKYVRKLARLSGKYPLNEKIAEKYAGALEALCRSDLEEKECDWESDDDPRIYGWMFKTYKEIISSLKLLTTIYPDNLSVFRSFLAGMSICILESEFDEGYEEEEEDGESPAGRLRNELEEYVFGELEEIKRKIDPVEYNEILASYVDIYNHLFNNLIGALCDTYCHDENDEFFWSSDDDDNTDFIYYLGRLKIIDNCTGNLYKKYPNIDYIVGIYSNIQFDLYIHTHRPELDVSSFHAEKEKMILDLYKKHKNNEYVAEDYGGYLRDISESGKIPASMQRMNKTKLKRLAKQFPENDEIKREYASLTEYLEEKERKQS